MGTPVEGAEVEVRQRKGQHKPEWFWGGVGVSGAVQIMGAEVGDADGLGGWEPGSRS